MENIKTDVDTKLEEENNNIVSNDKISTEPIKTDKPVLKVLKQENTEYINVINKLNINKTVDDMFSDDTEKEVIEKNEDIVKLNKNLDKLRKRIEKKSDEDIRIKDDLKVLKSSIGATALLNSAIVSIRNIERFHNKKTEIFYRKSIELQYRQLALTSEQLNVARIGNNIIKNQLEAIVLNTGSSEDKKMTIAERIKQMFWAELPNIMDSDDLPFKKIKSTIMSKGAEGIKKLLIKSQNKIAEHSKDTNIGNIVKDLNTDSVSTVEHKLSDLAKSSTIGKLFSDIIKSSVDNKKNTDVTIEKVNLEDEAKFDNLTKKSIVEVIPTLLSKIHNEIYTLRTGKEYESSNELTFDTNTQRLVTKKDLARKTSMDIKKHAKESFKTKLELVKTLTENSDIDFTDDDIVKLANAHTTDQIDGGSTAQSDILDNNIKDYLDDELNKKYSQALKIAKDKANKDKEYKKKVLEKIREHAQTPAIDSKYLEDMYNFGNEETLQEIGVIDENEEYQSSNINKILGNKSKKYVKKNPYGYGGIGSVGGMIKTPNVTKTILAASGIGFIPDGNADINIPENLNPKIVENINFISGNKPFNFGGKLNDKLKELLSNPAIDSDVVKLLTDFDGVTVVPTSAANNIGGASAAFVQEIPGTKYKNVFVILESVVDAGNTLDNVDMFAEINNIIVHEHKHLLQSWNNGFDIPNTNDITSYVQWYTKEIKFNKNGYPISTYLMPFEDYLKSPWEHEAYLEGNKKHYDYLVKSGTLDPDKKSFKQFHKERVNEIETMYEIGRPAALESYKKSFENAGWKWYYDKNGKLNKKALSKDKEIKLPTGIDNVTSIIPDNISKSISSVKDKIKSGYNDTRSKLRKSSKEILKTTKEKSSELVSSVSDIRDTIADKVSKVSLPKLDRDKLTVNTDKLSKSKDKVIDTVTRAKDTLKDKTTSTNGIILDSLTDNFNEIHYFAREAKDTIKNKIKDGVEELKTLTPEEEETLQTQFFSSKEFLSGQVTDFKEYMKSLGFKSSYTTLEDKIKAIKSKIDNVFKYLDISNLSSLALEKGKEFLKNRKLKLLSPEEDDAMFKEYLNDPVIVANNFKLKYDQWLEARGYRKPKEPLVKRILKKTRAWDKKIMKSIPRLVGKGAKLAFNLGVKEPMQNKYNYVVKPGAKLASYSLDGMLSTVGLGFKGIGKKDKERETLIEKALAKSRDIDKDITKDMATGKPIRDTVKGIKTLKEKVKSPIGKIKEKTNGIFGKVINPYRKGKDEEREELIKQAKEQNKSNTELKDKLTNLVGMLSKTIKKDEQEDKLEKIEAKKKEKEERKKKLLSKFDSDGDGDRDGNWKDRLSMFNKKKEPKEKKSLISKVSEKSKPSWLKYILPLLGAIVGFGKKMLGGLLNLPGKLLGGMKGMFGGITSAITKTVSGVGGSIASAAGAVATKAKGLVTSGVDKVKSVFGKTDVAKTTINKTTAAGNVTSKTAKPTKPKTSKIMSFLKSLKGKIIKKLGKSAGGKLVLKLSSKIAARLVPFAGAALLAYDAAKIGYYMLHDGLSFQSAVSKQILGFDLFNDDETPVDENGNPIKPDEPEVKENKNVSDNKTNDSKYKIKKGDTLSEIAKRHNTTVERLMELNPQIKNKDLIYSEDELTIEEGALETKKEKIVKKAKEVKKEQKPKDAKKPTNTKKVVTKKVAKVETKKPKKKKVMYMDYDGYHIPMSVEGYNYVKKLFMSGNTQDAIMVMEQVKSEYLKTLKEEKNKPLKASVSTSGTNSMGVAPEGPVKGPNAVEEVTKAKVIANAKKQSQVVKNKTTKPVKQVDEKTELVSLDGRDIKVTKKFKEELLALRAAGKEDVAYKKLARYNIMEKRAARAKVLEEKRAEVAKPQTHVVKKDHQLEHLKETNKLNKESNFKLDKIATHSEESIKVQNEIASTLKSMLTTLSGVVLAKQDDIEKERYLERHPDASEVPGPAINLQRTASIGIRG